MRVFSKIACGFGRDGRLLLQKGENTLEEPLSSTERAFINVMKISGVVTVLPEVPTAPVSETKIKTSTRVDVAKKPMRKRRSVTP